MTEHPLLLVPIDGSKLSARAIPLAADLARALDGRLLILTVVDDSVRKPMSEFATAEGISLTEAVNAMLGRAAHEAARDGDIDVAVEHMTDDNPGEAILRLADERAVAMLVLSSHGRSGASRWLLGSVAHKIVQAASVPVVVVPARRRDDDPSGD